jgi:hypothetical protein
MARAPVSKTGGWGFESLHSCQEINGLAKKSGGLRRVGVTPGVNKWPLVRLGGTAGPE